MTNREAQIFQWITENPMISQEELAAKAGIARSSAADITMEGEGTVNPQLCIPAVSQRADIEL